MAKTLETWHRRACKAIEIGKRFGFDTEYAEIDVMTELLNTPLDKMDILPRLCRWMVLSREDGGRYDSSADKSCFFDKFGEARSDAIEAGCYGWIAFIYDLDADTLNPHSVTKTTVAVVKYKDPLTELLDDLKGDAK